MLAIVAQILVNGILTASLYALVAGGLSFLYATTKIFHLAHGVVLVGSGYAFWWAWEVAGFPPVLAGLFAVLVAAAAGFAMNELVYEQLKARGTKGLGYLIATLALLMLGTGVILGLFGAAPKTFSFEPEVLNFGGVLVTTLQLWTVVITVLLLGLFWWLVTYTKFGKAMRATADNEEVARILGINTKGIRRLAFVLSSVLAAAAGILIGLEFSLDPNFGTLFVVRGFAAAVMGGVGGFAGAILGSLFIGVAEQGVVWFWGSGWRSAITFFLLFMFLLFKPDGILSGKRE